MIRLIDIPYRIDRLIQVKPKLKYSGQDIYLEVSRFEPDVVYFTSSRKIRILYQTPMRLDRYVTDGSFPVDLIYVVDNKYLCHSERCKELAGLGSIQGLYYDQYSGSIYYIASLDDRTILYSEDLEETVAIYNKWIYTKNISFSKEIYVILSSKGRFRRSKAVLFKGEISTPDNILYDCSDIYCILAYRHGNKSKIIYGDIYSSPVKLEINEKIRRVDIGYRIFGAVLDNSRSIIMPKNNDLSKVIEIPFRVKPLAWIDDLNLALLYNAKTGWITIDDSNSVKTIMIAKSEPKLLGSHSDILYLLVDNKIKIMEYESVIKVFDIDPKIKFMSASEVGLVMDYGSKLRVFDIYSQKWIDINKKADIRCFAYRDKILCLKDSILTIIDPYSTDTIYYSYQTKDYINLAIYRDNKHIDVSLSLDGKIVSSNNDLYRITPYKYADRINVVFKLDAFLESYNVSDKIDLKPPNLEIVESKMISSREGINVICGSRSILKIKIVGSLEKYNTYNKYIIELYSYRGESKVVHLQHSIDRETLVKLSEYGEIEIELCVEHPFNDSDIFIDLTIINGSSKLLLDSKKVELEFRDPIVDIDVYNLEVSSYINIKIGNRPHNTKGTFRIKCSNKELELGFKESDILIRENDRFMIEIDECEIPAFIIIELYDGLFTWIFKKNLVSNDYIMRCLDDKLNMVDYYCRIGGFYKKLHASSIIDYQPFDIERVSFLENELHIEGRVREPFCWSIVYDGDIRSGCVDHRNHSEESAIIKIKSIKVIPNSYLYLNIYTKRSVRGYMVKGPDMDKLLHLALETSYKLYKYLRKNLGD